jgi:TolB-like protein
VNVPRVGCRLVVQRKPAAIPVSHDRAGPPRLSIVVLPFANLGRDREQDYFAGGVTNSLTTDLSRIRGAFVIGRGTAFTYKGEAVNQARLPSMTRSREAK